MESELEMRSDLIRRSVIAFVIFLALCFGAALFGAQFQPGEWYEQLNKPGLTPPNWVFGPVWTVLYLMMAIAGWLVWRVDTQAKALALAIFAVQLFLNAMWSWLFFGLHDVGLALFDIAILWVAVLATTVLFWQLTMPAGVLLLPYLAWATFAAYLNFEIWRLNA